MADDQPNILFIQADQLKPQVMPGYGGKAVMPHLDRLCGEGVVFEEHARQPDACHLTLFLTPTSVSDIQK